MLLRETNDKTPILVLFRNDLRLSDNPALAAALQTGHPVLCLYVYETEGGPAFRPLGGASRWWLHHSLSLLSSSLEDRGGNLILRAGRLVSAVESLTSECGAHAVHANRRYDPAGVESDEELSDALKAADIPFLLFNGNLLHDPAEIRTGTDNPYSVYSPFARKLVPTIELGESKPDRVSGRFARHDNTDRLEDYRLLPAKPNWAAGFDNEWAPGETGASAALKTFLSERIDAYSVARDYPAKPGTSKLSPHLAFGEISPRRVWTAVAASAPAKNSGDVTAFRREIVFREFAWHVLANRPAMPWSNIDSRFDEFPWDESETNEDLLAWQRGQTGYPLVDAGMRQLWQTGWMHNRVRMLVASFLTKHLMVHWKRGEEWFHDTLVDFDPANNAFNWQWTAGSGADAAPFFRIFAPVTQSGKFDAEGAYIRQFVPELAALPDKFIHAPWEAPPNVLSSANVKLGSDYPRPIVEHAAARKRALAAFEAIKAD